MFHNCDIEIILAVLFLCLPISASCQNEMPSWKKEQATTSSIIDTFFLDRKCIRFKISKNDRNVFGGKRAEISTLAEVNSKVERIYDFDIALGHDFAFDTIPEIVAQWHAQPDKALGEKWRSPPISLSIYKGHWYLTIIWSSKIVNTNETVDGRYINDLGSVDYNRWIRWKFKIRFSSSEQGRVVIWQNGIKKVERIGPNYYNDIKGPYFKFGIYKWGWNNSQSVKGDFSSRVVYFSNVSSFKP